MASELLRNPEAREKHFQRCTASATMSILYDYPTLETENDKTLEEIHAYIDRISKAATPGEHLVDVFPCMIHIPDRSVLISIGDFSHISRHSTSLAKWKREGKQYFKQHTRMFETLFNNVRHEVVREHSEDLCLNCRNPCTDQTHCSLRGLKDRASVRRSSRMLTQANFRIRKWHGQLERYCTSHFNLWLWRALHGAPV